MKGWNLKHSKIWSYWELKMDYAWSPDFYLSFYLFIYLLSCLLFVCLLFRCHFPRLTSHNLVVMECDCLGNVHRVGIHLHAAAISAQGTLSFFLVLPPPPSPASPEEHWWDVTTENTSAFPGDLPTSRRKAPRKRNNRRSRIVEGRNFVRLSFANVSSILLEL